jgi:hypothetical protein
MKFALRIFMCALFIAPAFISVEGASNDIQSKKTTLSNTSRISPQPFLEVIDALLKTLREKKVEQGYNNYTSAEFRRKTSLEDFQKMVDKFKALNQNKLFQLQSFFIENDIVSFDGDLNSEGGETIPVELDFIMEDGKWKILGMQIYQNEISLPVQQK